MSLTTQDLEDLHRILTKLDPNGRPQRFSSTRTNVRAFSDSEPLVQRARQLFENRRKRIAIFGPQMFAEPAWEMLLILYLSEGGPRRTQTSLTELCGASRSTGMRWIDFLEGQGLVRRDEHPTDRRRNFVSLSDKGRDLLELYLSETG